LSTALRAQAQAEGESSGADGLFVGFSDDRWFFVPVLVLFVFFVFVIIIGGISRRHRVAAHDGDEAPNTLKDVWSHFVARLDVATFTDDVSARAGGRKSRGIGEGTTTQRKHGRSGDQESPLGIAWITWSVPRIFGFHFIRRE
jgi:hypothetical protein